MVKKDQKDGQITFYSETAKVEMRMAEKKLFSIDEPSPPQLATKIENKNKKIYLVKIFLCIDHKNINKKSAFRRFFSSMVLVLTF